MKAIWMRLLFVGVLALPMPANADAPSNGVTAPASPAPSENTFKIGDAIELTVVGYENEIKGVYRVNPTGALEVPYIGTIPAEGKTLVALRTAVEDKVRANYLHNPQVIMRPLYTVSVLGSVNRPGAFEVTGGEHLSQLIAMAGGNSYDGRIDRARVTRSGRTIQANLREAIETGRTVDDVGIRSGDVVFIPKSAWYRSFQNWAILVSSVSLAFAIYDRIDRNN